MAENPCRSIFAAACLAAALRHLRRADPVMRSLIRSIGPCTLAPNGSRFQVLVRIILSQQLSGKAAHTIRSRLEALVAPSPIAPETLCQLEMAQLRKAGISGYKARFIQELAKAVLEGSLNLEALDGYSDEQVIEALTKLRGVGVWSAKNFLIFALGRPNVFPENDAGLRGAIRMLYFSGRVPTEGEIRAIVSAWTPYATVACWYCWRSLDI
jgi:DNA-3-methyladenine glycosylase II